MRLRNHLNARFGGRQDHFGRIDQRFLFMVG
jgi:hypothetical protein